MNDAFGQKKISPEGQSQPPDFQIACFRIGEEMYGLDIMRIREIIRPQKVTSVPKAPSFIEGVINLRGAVIPVVDLRKRFDLQAQNDRKTRIIICRLSGRLIGLMVDEVTEVRRYAREDVQPTPRFLRGKAADFFSAVCRRDDDVVFILNVEKLLSSGEKVTLEPVQQVQRRAASASSCLSLEED